MSQTKIQELLDESDHYRSVRLSEATIKRLQSNATKYRDSYESIINRILDEKEGKDVNSQFLEMSNELKREEARKLVKFQELMSSLSEVDNNNLNLVEPRIGSIDKLMTLVNSVKRENKDRRPNEAWEISNLVNMGASR